MKITNHSHTKDVANVQEGLGILQDSGRNRLILRLKSGIL